MTADSVRSIGLIWVCALAAAACAEGSLRDAGAGGGEGAAGGSSSTGGGFSAGGAGGGQAGGAGAGDAGGQALGGGDAGEALVDGGHDAGTPTDAGFFVCVEAEALDVDGGIRWPGPPETHGGVVTLPGQGQGALQWPVALDAGAVWQLWARVRAPTHSNNSVMLTLDSVAPGVDSTWDIPVSPVPRWHPASRRGDAGTFYAPLQLSWPGWVDAGPHVFRVFGRESDVELDALCLSPAPLTPPERWVGAGARQRVVALTGAAGNGVTDDTAALQTALSALVSGDVLALPAGRFRFTSTLAVTTSAITVRGQGPQSVLFADLPPDAGGRAVAVMGQGESNTTPLTADAPPLAREVSVAPTASFAVGDVVLVRCDDWGDAAPNVPWPLYRFRANTAHVASVRTEASARVLVLDRPLLSEFLVSRQAMVEKVRGLHDVAFESLTIEGPDRPDANDNPDIDLLGIQRCDRCVVSDVTLRHMKVSGLDSFRTLDNAAVRVHVLDATDTGGGGHGYGVTANRSQGLVVRDGQFDGVYRHGVPISWGARETLVVGNVFDRTAPQSANRFASVDVHGEDDYANLIEGNTILGGDPGVIIGGGGSTHGNDGAFNVVRGNHLVGTTDGVAVYKQTPRTVIENNRIESPSGSGVRIETGSDETYVWGNQISAWGTAGVAVSASAGADIRVNRFTPGVGPAVLVRPTSSGYFVIDNFLGDAGIIHPDAGMVQGNR